MRTTFPPTGKAAALLVCACAGLGLAACNTTGPAPSAPTASTESRHPIEVSLERMRLPIAASSGRFEGAQRDALALFLDRAGAQRGDRVSLLTAGDPAANALSSQVSADLERRGLRVSASPGAPSGGAAVEVIVERYEAHAVDCPDWSKAPGGDPSNRVDSNFGCASQAELAAMVVDAHDLIVGREPGPQTGLPGSHPTELYRLGHTPALGATAPPSASGGGGSGSGAGAGGGGAPQGGM